MIVCLIESPYQAFVLDQLVKQNKVNKKNLTIFVNDKNLENGSFLESILAKLSFPYPNIFIIRKKIKSALPMGILFFKLFFSRTIIIGDILSPWMGLIAKYFFFKRIILLEDGTSQFVDNKEIEEHIKNLDGVERYSLIGNESLLSEAGSKIFKIDITDVQINLSIPAFISKIQDNPNLPLFFGAPIVSFNNYIQASYNKICIDSLITLSSHEDGSPLAIYLKHRREIDSHLPDNFLKLESGGIDFALLELCPKIQEEILKSRVIISFPSTSLCILARGGLLRQVDEIKLIHITDLGYSFQERHNDLVTFVYNILKEEVVNVSIYKTRTT
tara:strand:- start:434 stop:1423 length:990 start_codon:yes stop_codon:yes gene_type:complete